MAINIRTYCTVFSFAAACLVPTFGFGQDISGLTISPNPLVGGGTATGTINLSKAAGSGGLTITLTSSETAAATVPASVTVAAGAKSATFSITTLVVKAASKATIKGEDPSKKTASDVLTVNPIAVRLASLAIEPKSISSGQSATGTVTLSEAAPTSGFAVSLSTKQSTISIPQSVTVKSGAKTATFSITATAVTAAGTATITSSDTNGYQAVATLAVTEASVRLTALGISPASVTAGSPATGSVVLSANAPAGGLSVSLSSGQSYITMPASVSVKAGAKTATFTITTSSVTASSTATINGTDKGGYKASATLTVTPQNSGPTIQTTSSLTFSPQSLTVAAGTTVTWTNPSFMSHTATADISGTGPSSSSIAPGQSYTWTVPASAKSGTKFYYHCQYHGFAGNGSTLGQGMAGVIIVQ